MAITKVNHPDLLDLASDTGATVFPKGTTAQRSVSPEAGYIRFNTTDNVMETYDGTEWKVLDNVSVPYQIDYLVVAGGGGGAGIDGGGVGGGGAGGLLQGTNYNLTPETSYTITVGSGGAYGTGGSKGVDSTFSTITSIGGGGGVSRTGLASNNNGGSGGGASEYPTVTDFGVGTAGQGNNGGIGDINGAGGGGGGAGSVGGNGSTSTNGGNGGSGINSSITGTSLTYSIGGGGSANYTVGGSPNGGQGYQGTQYTTTTNGTAQTGMGGGGSYETTPGNGGSGVVILRMPTANYSGTTTGSPTVTTDGTDTILTYTSSGTYTA